MTDTRKLLVIDDDPDIGEVIEATALGMGFECTITNDLSGFLTALALDISLIMVDLMMPGIDGIEVLRQLAARNCRANVILMSGMEKRVIETAEKMARALGLRVAGYLQKPFRVEALECALANRPQMPESLPAKPSPAVPFTAIELRAALDRSEFILHYQPQVNLGDYRVIGLEALARWLHPVRGMVAPDRFIPQLDELHLLDRFTWQVIERALRESASFGSLEGAAPTLSMNVSAQSLYDLTFPDRIASAADQHGFSAAKIVLEITESGLIQELPRTLDVLTRLRIKQIQLSIDDFGTGYSMMQQLQLVPATELKIDRAFVKDLDTNDSHRVLVQKTVELGHGLGMRVIGEGVETREQEELLRLYGCDAAQGFLYCRPLPPNELVRWLTARQA